jgi:hypothetical protein
MATVAPHWRLTELGYMRDPPTRDFAKWDGRAFKDKIKPRAKKRPALAIVVPYKIQNPVPEKRHGVCPKSGTPPCPKRGTLSALTVPENGHIGEPGDRARKRAHRGTRRPCPKTGT